MVALRNPKLLTKVLGAIFFIALLIVGMVTGVVITAAQTPAFLLGYVFMSFLLPYFAGRFSGAGSFDVEDMNFIFTAPILPRAILLSGLIRRLGGIFFIALSIMIFLTFVSAMFMAITLPQILIAGVFGFVLTVVCKLFGMYLFVVYKKAYRWIGFLWILLLAGGFVFYAARADWDFAYGFIDLLMSPVFALTPLVGWAAAGAVGFMMGHVYLGLFLTGLLIGAGVYFLWAVYKLAPVFLDIDGADDVRSMESSAYTKPEAADNLPPAQDAAIAKDTPNPLAKILSRGKHPSFKGIGAQVFYYKHAIEESRGRWLKIFDAELFWWGVFAIAWGMYATSPDLNLEFVAMMYIIIGVPSETILAVVAPLVFSVVIAPQFEQGFMEFSSHYFYMMPDSPKKKLLWVSMSQIVGVCTRVVLVLGIAGIISRTTPGVVVGAMLAYMAAAFMALGVRAASVRLFGGIPGARQKLASTMLVLFITLVGWVGMMAVFFLGAAAIGPALYIFAGWCGVAGGIGTLYAVRTMHDVDTTV